jgi:hypothetical protein
MDECAADLAGDPPVLLAQQADFLGTAHDRLYPSRLGDLPFCVATLRGVSGSRLDDLLRGWAPGALGGGRREVSLAIAVPLLMGKFNVSLSIAGALAHIKGAPVSGLNFPEPLLFHRAAQHRPFADRRRTPELRD